MDDLRVRRISYDIADCEISPGPGDYLVSMSKTHTPNRVYQVCSVRKVNSKKYPFRFALEVIRRPALLASVTVLYGVWVNATPAFTLYWHSRKKESI